LRAGVVSDVPAIILTSPATETRVLTQGQRELMGCKGCLLSIGAGFGLAFASTMLFAWAIRGAVTPDTPTGDLVIGAFVLLTFLLWGLFTLAIGHYLAFIERSRIAARRRQFEARPMLTDDEFARLFPNTISDAPTVVRAEIERFSERVDVCRRLVPADPLRSACWLFGFCPDDIDWAKFLGVLEVRFGVRIPDEAFQPFEDPTVAQLIDWCTGPQQSAEPVRTADRGDGG
jgi:hypothetical protein